MNVAGFVVKEIEELKTLGVVFDNGLNFRKHWDNMTKSSWCKIYALSHLKSYLSLKHRAELGRGLILSKISYCLEATSTCP